MMRTSINIDNKTRNHWCILFKFFSRKIFFYIFNETLKDINLNLFIYLKRTIYFFCLKKRSRAKTFLIEIWIWSWRKAIVCSTFFSPRFFFFSRSFFFFFFFFLSHRFFLVLFLLFDRRLRLESEIRAKRLLSVDAKSLLRRKTRIDRDENAWAFSIVFDNVENIVVDVSFDDAIK